MLVGNEPNKYNCAGCGQPITMINSTVGKCLCCENYTEVSEDNEVNIFIPTEEPKPDSKLSPEMKKALIAGVGIMAGLVAAKMIFDKKKDKIPTSKERARQARQEARKEAKQRRVDAKLAMRDKLKGMNPNTTDSVNDRLSTWASFLNMDTYDDSDDVTFTEPLND